MDAGLFQPRQPLDFNSLNFASTKKMTRTTHGKADTNVCGCPLTGGNQKFGNVSWETAYHREHEIRKPGGNVPRATVEGGCRG
jgi:hypothetical protein